MGNRISAAGPSSASWIEPSMPSAGTIIVATSKTPTVSANTRIVRDSRPRRPSAITSCSAAASSRALA